MIEIEGLDHLVLNVRDMDRSIQFYCEVLGCSEERRVDSLGLVQLRAGDSLIDLIPLTKSNADVKGNMDHFCLRVKQFDPDVLRQYLLANNVEAGEAAKRYGAQGYGDSIYIEDPDGNVVELKGAIK